MKKLLITSAILALSIWTLEFSNRNNTNGQATARSMSERRQAFVHIKNKTGTTYKFQVLHQYTGEQTQSSAFVEIPPDGDAYMLTVSYNTGTFTTGVDNWIINGVERRKLNSNFKLPMGANSINIGGENYLDIRYNSGTGFGSSWKVHTLKHNDHGKDTTIEIYPTTVEFKSESGSSSTKWMPEWNII